MTEFAESVCDQHSDLGECPDSLISYSLRFDEYGIALNDGGSARVAIAFCPFCGMRLPESKRDRWFDELEQRGISDPTVETIPVDFQSDKWWRKL